MRLPEIDFNPKHKLKWETWHTNSFRTVISPHQRLVFIIEKTRGGFYTVTLCNGFYSDGRPRPFPHKTIIGDKIGYTQFKTAQDEARRWLTSRLKAQGK